MGNLTVISNLASAPFWHCVRLLTALPGGYSGPQRSEQKQPTYPCPEELFSRVPTVPPASHLLSLRPRLCYSVG